MDISLPDDDGMYAKKQTLSPSGQGGNWARRKKKTTTSKQTNKQNRQEKNKQSHFTRSTAQMFFFASNSYIFFYFVFLCVVAVNMRFVMLLCVSTLLKSNKDK